MRTFEEKMSDINKDQLLDRILHSGDFTALEKRYLEELVKAPPIIHGSWIREECDKSGMRCSECKSWKNGLRKVKYCPNCGADMKEDRT